MIPSAKQLVYRNKSINRDKLQSYIQYCLTESYKNFNTETPVKLETKDEFDYAKKLVKPYGYKIVEPEFPAENMYIIKPENN